MVAGAADWLLEHPPKWKDRFFFYGAYYYAQGMYQRGGDHAETAEKLVQDTLLEKQNEDGSWGREPKGPGLTIYTGVALVALEIVVVLGLAHRRARLPRRALTAVAAATLPG